MRVLPSRLAFHPGLLFILLLHISSVSKAQNASQTTPSAPWIGPWTRAAEQPVIRPQPGAVFRDPVTVKDVHWEALHTFVRRRPCHLPRQVVDVLRLRRSFVGVATTPLR